MNFAHHEQESLMLLLVLAVRMQDLTEGTAAGLMVAWVRDYTQQQQRQQKKQP